MSKLFAMNGPGKDERKGFEILQNPWILLAFSVVIGFFAVFFGSASTSPLFPEYSFAPSNGDSGYFQLGGKMILAGKNLYLDLYDHKGLYLYTLNAIGMAIHPRFGVFLVQWFRISSLVFASALCMKSLKAPSFFFLLAMLLSAMGYVCYYCGNQSGEAVMPWVIWTLYFYLRGYLGEGKKYFYLGSLFAGFEAAFSFASRPSEAAWALAFVVAYFVYYLRKEKNLELLWNALIALASFGAVTMVFVGWAIEGNFLKEMWDCAIVTNLNYLGHHYAYAKIVMAILSAVTYVLFAFGYKSYRRILGQEGAIALLIILGIGALMETLIAHFPHYWLSALPCFSFAFMVLLLDWYQRLPEAGKFKKHYFAIWGSAMLSAFVALSSIYTISYYTLEEPASEYTSILNSKKAEDVSRKNLDVIKANGLKDGDVYCFDAVPEVYLYLGVFPANKYFTNQTWFNMDNPTVEQATIDYLSEGKPKYIVHELVGFEAPNEAIYAYINAHYTKISTDYYFEIFAIN